MKKIALCLLVAGTVSVNASRLADCSNWVVTQVKGVPGAVSSNAKSFYEICNSHRGWTAAAVGGSLTSWVAYKKSERIRNIVKYVPRKLGLAK